MADPGAIIRESIIVRNAYKLVPLIVLAIGLSKGVGKSKSLFHFNYAVAVQSEVNAIARRITQDALTGMTVPTPEDFVTYIHNNFRKQESISRDQAVDLWGTPYSLSVEGGVGRVASAGPDKKPGTSDDLVAEARLVE